MTRVYQGALPVTAIFSPDGLYRYRLERDLGALAGELVVCAWGAHAKPNRVAAVRRAIERAGRGN